VVNGVGKALRETSIFGFSVVILFGIGILVLDPTWWTRGISDYAPFPLSEITNAELTIFSVIGLLGGLLVNRRYRTWHELFLKEKKIPQMILNFRVIIVFEIQSR